MIAAVADTHTAVWYLFNNPKLSAGARRMIEEAFRAGDQIGVSAISLAEMVYLAEKGRIPSTAVHDLIQGLFDPEYPLHELPVDAAVAQQMASISRDEVPDMPDRIIAATGLRYGVPVISRDGKIRALRIETTVADRSSERPNDSCDRYRNLPPSRIMRVVVPPVSIGCSIPADISC